MLFRSNLITIAARGGNYLLNVGPDGLGDVPVEARQCLKETGEWLSRNGEAIYNTQRSGLHPAWGECVRKDYKKNSVLYLCVFDWPTDGKLHLQGDFTGRRATLLADGSPLKLEARKGSVTIQLPAGMPDRTATVIRLDLKEKLPAIKLVSNSEKVFKIVDTE